MTEKEFTDGWKHFLNHINFEASNIDADSAKFMNEMPGKIIKCVNEYDNLVEALDNLIFTASKLWDEVKPIKDGDAIVVTHPIIEQAKQALANAKS